MALSDGGIVAAVARENLLPREVKILDHAQHRRELFRCEISKWPFERQRQIARFECWIAGQTTQGEAGCDQFGARRHGAIPRAKQRDGFLDLVEAQQAAIERIPRREVLWICGDRLSQQRVGCGVLAACLQHDRKVVACLG